MSRRGYSDFSKRWRRYDKRSCLVALFAWLIIIAGSMLTFNELRVEEEPSLFESYGDGIVLGIFSILMASLKGMPKGSLRFIKFLLLNGSILGVGVIGFILTVVLSENCILKMQERRVEELRRKGLIRLVEENDFEGLEYLLRDAGAKNAFQKNNIDETAFMIACKKGYFKFVETLYCYGDVNINDQSAQSNTALHFAAERGDFPLVHYLVNQKASLSLTNIRKKTPLDLASENNHDDVIGYLRRKGAKRYVPTINEVKEKRDDEWEQEQRSDSVSDNDYSPGIFAGIEANSTATGTTDQAKRELKYKEQKRQDENVVNEKILVQLRKQLRQQLRDNYNEHDINDVLSKLTGDLTTLFTRIRSGSLTQSSKAKKIATSIVDLLPVGLKQASQIIIEAVHYFKTKDCVARLKKISQRLGSYQGSDKIIKDFAVRIVGHYFKEHSTYTAEQYARFGCIVVKELLRNLLKPNTSSLEVNGLDLYDGIKTSVDQAMAAKPKKSIATRAANFLFRRKKSVTVSTVAQQTGFSFQ